MVQTKNYKQQASVIPMIDEAQRFLAWLDEQFGIEKGSNQYTVVIESGGQKRDCLGTFGPERWTQLGGAHSKKEFKPRAEEHGLDCWKSEQKPSKGYAFTSLTEEMWDRILSEFKPNIEVWDMARQTIVKEPKQSSMQSLKCGCTVDDDGKKIGSTVSMSRVEVQTRLDADELPYCKRCKQDFLPQD